MFSPFVKLSAYVGALVFALTVRADFTENLVARWTFEKQGPKLFMDDSGSAPLTPDYLPGFSGEVARNADGSVTLQPGQYLMTPKISSKKLASLQGAVTIWARLKIEPGAQEHTAFLFGFLRDSQPGDWDNASFVLAYRPQVMRTNTGLFCYGNIDQDKPMGGGSNVVAEKPGEYVSVAVVFDGSRGLMTLVVDGEVKIARREGAMLLAPSSVFAIGQLQTTADTAVTFDEIRIYSTALSPDWIAEITPVKK